MARTSTIGTLAVNIVARTRGFDRGIDKTQKKTEKLSKSMKSASNVVLAFAAATAAAATATTFFVKQQFEAIDALTKTADKLGIATDELGALRFAAEQTGVAANTLDMALQRMTRRLSEAAMDTGEAKDALKELNLNAKELNQLSPDQAFRRIAAAMALVSNEADKVRLAFKLFDSEGVSLVNTLNLGVEGLDEMEQRARELGITFDRRAAEQIVKANDAINELKNAGVGAFRALAIELAPLVKLMADFATSAALSSDAPGLFKIRKGSPADAAREFLRGLQLTDDRPQDTSFAGFLEFLRTQGASVITDIGPRSTTAGPNNRRFQTPEGVARFNNEQRQQMMLRDAGKRIAEGFIPAATSILRTANPRGGTERTVGRALGSFFDAPGNALRSIQAASGQLQVGLMMLQRQAAIAQGNRPASQPVPTLAALQAGTAEAFAASRRNLNPAQRSDQQIAKNTGQTVIALGEVIENLERIAENQPKEVPLA